MMNRDDLVKLLMSIPPDAPLRIALDVPAEFVVKHGVVWGSIDRISTDPDYEDPRIVGVVQPYNDEE